MSLIMCEKCQRILPFGRDMLSIVTGFDMVTEDGAIEYPDGINAAFYCDACFPDSINLDVTSQRETARSIKRGSKQSEYYCWICEQMIPDDELRFDVSANRSVFLLDDNADYVKVSTQIFGCCAECLAGRSELSVTGIHGSLQSAESFMQQFGKLNRFS